MPLSGLIPFVDRLPIPRVLKPVSQNRISTNYIVRMTEFRQKLHRDLPPTRLWGYEGKYPGPTIETHKNRLIKVLWLNKLPSRHLLPVDKTIHGANHGAPEVRTVVHVHDGVSPPDSDGHPEAWFTRGFKQTGPYFRRKISRYPNRQQATTLWYHDHALGITRLNVYAGLAGFYLLRDKHEKSLQLPKGKFEIPLLIQDRSFNKDGSLFYPKKPTPAPPKSPTPSIVPEFFGDTILVNGKVWPFLEVQPRKYRLRLANGSNARFYTLSFTSGQPFIQIGTDGGLLPKPVLVKKLILGPAERADVIVDFSKYKGQTITLKNNARAPFPNGDPVDPKTTGLVMQFRVTQPLKQKDNSRVPVRLNRIAPLFPHQASRVRNLPLVESTDRFGRLMLLLDNKRWDDPITEKPRLNSVEVWNLINTTPDTHPIHLHLVHFQIVNRQPFDVAQFNANGKLMFTGPSRPPDPNEKGLKDTVRANPGEVTRIIARFGPFTGEYVWHCHILEHEDHEMMRPMFISPNKTKSVVHNNHPTTVWIAPTILRRLSSRRVKRRR
ncbi:multicopper oxidase family protein [Paenibacillus xerothermodurans]|uniref:Multicopper oxidase family protein n=1 Tax=Paenibacillus xerothermodurans TaxID=1977292 RepID=A0A2W1NQV4_PAEXE|nr:multicopper oxidase [Paenibacillus xerothermodurans]PZE21875.1 multicopper oxidase family protein [Paenibacillus xerothermodurans]